jgi:hypothetical protein
MYREVVRDLNEVERETLREMIETTAPPVSGWETLKWVLVALGAIGLLVLLAIGLIVLKPNPVLGGLLGGVLATVGILCLYVIIVVSSGHFRWGRVTRCFREHTVPLVERTLRDGKVLSKDVTATTVIEIIECEDEGSAYIFAIEDNRSLLLKGQRFVPAKEDMPWPAAAFSIVRSRDGKLWIGLFSTGLELGPTQSLSMERCKEEFCWSESENLVEGRPEDVLGRVLKAERL